MAYRYCFAFSLLFLVNAALADQVTLANGDHLTGSVVKADDKVLTLKTEFAGTIDIQWSGIKNFVSDEPLAVTPKGATKAVEGKVEASNDTVVVASAGGPVKVPKAELSVVRTPNDQAVYEGSLHRSLLHGWDGGVNVGFALTGGNSQTTNLALAFTGTRPTATDKLSLYANTLYSTNNSPGAFPTTTANNVQGGARYDRNISAKLFAFVNTDFMSDSLQELDLRSVFGGGLGFHAIKNEHSTLDFLGGGNYTREAYTTFKRNLAAITLGQEYTHKLKSTDLKEKLYFFPDLSETGQYRSTFDFATVTKLNKRLGWQNAFSDVYVSNPPSGKRKNDLVFTTGLNVSFSH